MWYMYYCKIFTTIRLVNTFFMSHNYHFVVMVRTLKLYFHSNFPLYNNVVNLALRPVWTCLSLSLHYSCPRIIARLWWQLVKQTERGMTERLCFTETGQETSLPPGAAFSSSFSSGCGGASQCSWDAGRRRKKAGIQDMSVHTDKEGDTNRKADGSSWPRLKHDPQWSGSTRTGPAGL